MEDLNFKFQAKPRNKGMSCSHFLFKFLLICLFLSVLPLLPTEPPEFVSHTVFAKIWGLIHLLVIGIVLSYGLFCIFKTPQVSPKSQISKPYGTNILNHSSLFDYGDENPSGNFANSSISTPQNNFSYYRTEPYVAVRRRENCRNFEDTSLGLPVRSLRSRIVESDCSDSDGGEECDSFGSNCRGIPESGNGQILEGNVGNLSPNSWTSRSMGMGGDFMAGNGKFEMNQLNFESFRVPTQPCYQKNNGFCSWLPESPNMEQYPVGLMAGFSSMEGGSSWRGESFEMPVSGFSTQGLNSNVMGIPSNLEKGNLGKFYMPSSAEVPSSMAAPDFDLGSSSRRYVHERVSWGEPSTLENGNLGVQKSDFFMPLATTPPLVSVPDCDFASSLKPSSSSKFNNEIGNLGWEEGKFYMPSSAEVPSSMAIPDFDLGSSSRRYVHERVSWGEPSTIENGNLGVQKSDFFMPLATTPPLVSVPDCDFASSLKPSRSSKFNNEIEDLGISPNFEHGSLDCEKNSFLRPSVSVPDKDFTSSTKPSRSRIFSHESKNFGKSPSFENAGVSFEGLISSSPSPAVPTPVPNPENGFGSSVKRSKSGKFSHENGNSGKSLNLENRKSDGEKNISFVTSAAELPSVCVPEKAIGLSVKKSRSRRTKSGKFRHENGDLENRNFDVEKTNSVVTLAADSPSVSVPEKGSDSSIKKSRSRRFRHENGDLGKSPNLEKGSLSEEKTNSFIHSAEDPLSVSASETGFALSKSKKNEKEPKNDNMGNSGEVNDSSSPHCADPLLMPTQREDYEKRSIPMKWDDDYFVILSPENKDMGNVDQENPSHGLAYSSESPSLCGGSISGLSGNPSASANISEIEELIGDNDSYKPSTPSPPPRVQTRRDDFPSSLESSSTSMALSNVSLVDKDDELGSPPTPERGKALSRTSHPRRFSFGSFFDRDHAKEAKRKGGKSCGWDCLKLDVKPALTKATLKGKSVRTIRPRETPLEPPPQEEKPGMVVIQIGISEKSGGRSDKKQGNGSTSIIVGFNSKESSKVKAITNAKEEETSDIDEIDRKAGEFIAKFKEQMRLQKVAATARGESSNG